MLQEDEGDRQHKDVQLEKLVYLFSTGSQGHIRIISPENDFLWITHIEQFPAP
jgi:hypothetical protein